MDVSIRISDTDSQSQRNKAYAVMALVYGTGVPTKIAPEDNPAVGNGVPPVPNEASQSATPSPQAPSAGSVASESTAGITLIEKPGLPAEIMNPAVAAGPANVPGGMPKLDKAGLPWDARIHSDSKNINDGDGLWRKRRGVTDKDFIARVEAELRALVGTTHMQNALTDEQRGVGNQYLVPGVSEDTAKAVQAGVPITVSPQEAQALAAASQASMQRVPAPPAAESAAMIPPPPAAVTPPPASNGIPPHVALMRQIGPLITTDANPNGFITASDVAMVCKHLNIVDAAGNGQITLLGTRPDLLDDFRDSINEVVSANAMMSGRVAPAIQ